MSLWAGAREHSTNSQNINLVVAPPFIMAQPLAPEDDDVDAQERAATSVTATRPSAPQVAEGDQSANAVVLQMSFPPLSAPRVMIPSPLGIQYRLTWFHCRCARCQTECVNPAMRSQCGQFGHEACLASDVFQGLLFCSMCVGYAIDQHSKQQDEATRQA